MSDEPDDEIGRRRAAAVARADAVDAARYRWLKANDEQALSIIGNWFPRAWDAEIDLARRPGVQQKPEKGPKLVGGR